MAVRKKTKKKAVSTLVSLSQYRWNWNIKYLFYLSIEKYCTRTRAWSVFYFVRNENLVANVT